MLRLPMTSIHAPWMHLTKTSLPVTLSLAGLSAHQGEAKSTMASSAEINSAGHIHNHNPTHAHTRNLQADKAAITTLPTVLDQSAWPIVHGTVGSTDATNFHTPVTGGVFKFATTANVEDKNTGVAQMLLTGMLGAVGGGGLRSIADQASALLGFSLADANPVSIITEKRADGSTILWTSTIKNVIAYRKKAGLVELETLDKFDHGFNLRFHGSYAFVGKTPSGQSGFFTTDNDSLVRYQLNGSDAQGWKIVETGRLALPTTLNPDGSDHLVGVTVLPDGSIVVGSKNGILMAARLTADGSFIMMDTMALGDFTRTAHTEISNSISSAGQQIYVVSQREMIRADFDNLTGRFAFKWSTIYGPQEPWFVGRLGPGSGSTPTVLQCQDKSLVVITDGALPMNIIWYDTVNGNVVGQRKVQFTPNEEGNLPTTSEQSVAVDGCRAFIVQNYMGMDSLDDDVFCNTAPEPGMIRRQIPEICKQLVPANSTDLFVSRACPAALGCMNYGVGVYEVQPQFPQPNGQAKVIRKWSRMDKTCGTSIPLISRGKDGSNAAYCVGADVNSSQWALMGMDLETGKDVLNYRFYKDYGAKNLFVNPFYAGVEGIGEDQVAIGSVGGVVIVAADKNAGIVPRMRSLSADFAGEVKQGVSSALQGNVRDITMPVGATLVAAGLAILVVLFVVFRRGKQLVSPRLPYRS